MKKVTHRFKKFNMESSDDMEEYNELLNNPLVHITHRELLVEKVVHMGDKGKVISHEDRPNYLVHWEEQVL